MPRSPRHLSCQARLTADLPGFSPPPQIATVLALEKDGPAALQSLEGATAAAGAGGITIPTAYKR